MRIISDFKKGLSANKIEMTDSNLIMECNMCIKELDGTISSMISYVAYSEGLASVGAVILQKIKDFFRLLVTFIQNVINAITGNSDRRAFSSGGSSSTAPDVAVNRINTNKDFSEDAINALKNVLEKHKNVIDESHKLDRLMKLMIGKSVDVKEVDLFNKRNPLAVKYFDLLMKGYGPGSPKAEALLKDIRRVGIENIMDELKKDKDNNTFTRRVVCDLWLAGDTLRFINDTKNLPAYAKLIERYFNPTVLHTAANITQDVNNRTVMYKKQQYLDFITKVDFKMLTRAPLSDITAVGEMIAKNWETINGISTEGMKSVYADVKYQLSTVKQKMDEIYNKLEKEDGANLEELIPLFFIAKLNHVMVTDIYNSTIFLNGIIARIDIAIYLHLENLFGKELNGDEFKIKI